MMKIKRPMTKSHETHDQNKTPHHGKMGLRCTDGERGEVFGVMNSLPGLGKFNFFAFW